MAMVPENVWRVYFQFRDNNGNLASTSANFSSALDYDAALAAAAALATDVAAISDAKLESYNISATFVNDSTVEPADTSEVERKLSITMGTATYPAASSLSIPSPVFAIEQPRTDAVDPTDGLWTALQSQLTNGGLGGGNGVTTYRGEDLTRVTRAVITHRNRKPRV